MPKSILDQSWCSQEDFLPEFLVFLNFRSLKGLESKAWMCLLIRIWRRFAYLKRTDEIVVRVLQRGTWEIAIAVVRILR